MTRRCQVTGKMAQVGNKVSHANNKSLRRFNINLQNASVYSESLKKFIKLRVTPSGLRTIEHNGGFDAWVMSIAPSKLEPEVRDARKQVAAATKAAS